MRKVKNEKSSSNIRKIRPALTPEARENQLISLAVDLAEKQLQEGTASAQVITHYLKLGSTKEQLEKEKLRNENLLIEAKTKSFQSMDEIKTMYEEALIAMRHYSGADRTDD